MALKVYFSSLSSASEEDWVILDNVTELLSSQHRGDRPVRARGGVRGARGGGQAVLGPCGGAPQLPDTDPARVFCHVARLGCIFSAPSN